MIIASIVVTILVGLAWVGAIILVCLCLIRFLLIPWILREGQLDILQSSSPDSSSDHSSRSPRSFWSAR